MRRITPVLALFLMSCNAFSPIDKPSGDAQLLSAARACFDRGDIACAKEKYAQVSASNAEVAASESAFAALDDAGVTMGNLMGAIGSGGGGGAVNKMAETLATKGPGSAKRVAIYDAYKSVVKIQNNKELRGLVRFVTSFALISEIFSEEIGADGILHKSNIVSDPNNCKSAIDTGCSAPAGAKIQAGTSLDFVTDPANQVVSGAPTLGMINGAFDAMSLALSSTELGVGGKFSSGAGDFAKALVEQKDAAEGAYRFTLIGQGVGE